MDKILDEVLCISISLVCTTMAKFIFETILIMGPCPCPLVDDHEKSAKNPSSLLVLHRGFGLLRGLKGAVREACKTF